MKQNLLIIISCILLHKLTYAMNFDQQSLFKEKIHISNEQLISLLPETVQLSMIDEFESKLGKAYEQLIKQHKEKDKTFNKEFLLAKQHQNDKKYPLALQAYANAYLLGTKYERQKIYHELYWLAPIISRQDEIPPLYYALAGSDNVQAKWPLYIVLTQAQKHHNTCNNEVILLLASIIRTGDASALDQLGTYYMRINQYYCAEQCYHSAAYFQLWHAYCRLSDFYRMYINAHVMMRSDKKSSLERSEYAYACRCWEEHECVRGRKQAMRFLAKKNFFNNQEARLASLEKAACDGECYARKLVIQWYEQQGRYTQALAWCDENEYYKKGQLYEKELEYTQAEEHYKLAAMKENEMHYKNASRFYTLQYVRFLIKQKAPMVVDGAEKKNVYEIADNILQEVLKKGTTNDIRKAYTLLAAKEQALGDYYKDYYDEFVCEDKKHYCLSEMYYMEAALQKYNEYFPKGLVILYLNHPTLFNGLYCQEIIRAYTSGSYYYGKGLLVEYVKESDWSTEQDARTYFKQSLYYGETLKAVQRLSIYCGPKKTLNYIERSRADGLFKEKARAIINNAL